MNEDSAKHRFWSKALLFGEYTIIKGSKALALPLDAFSGAWAWAQGNAAPLQQQLSQFAHHLAQDPNRVIDADAFLKELKQGLYFDSNIPNGYGLGSSGAVVAAVYARYATAARPPLADLRRILGRMEQFFHASSSGVDPLISLLNQPVLLHAKGEVELLPQWEWPKQHRFFIYDTGMARQTGPLVELFLKKCQDAAFEAALHAQFIPLVDAAIAHVLAAEEEAFFQCCRAISQFQWAAFREMIPPAVQPFWHQALQEDAPCAYKLCGAGGGGFMLGICRREMAKTERFEHPVLWLHD